MQYKDKVERGNGIKTSLELRTEAVTGKLQEATLKREAALTVRSTYKEILELLKKVASSLAPIYLDKYFVGIPALQLHLAIVTS